MTEHDEAKLGRLARCCADCCSMLRSTAPYSSSREPRFFIYEQKFHLITAPSLGKRDLTGPRQEMKDKGENGLIAAGGATNALLLGVWVENFMR